MKEQTRKKEWKRVVKGRVLRFSIFTDLCLWFIPEREAREGKREREREKEREHFI